MVPEIPMEPTLSSESKPPGAVVDWIRSRGPALVALSGGVDSSLVASLAYEALGAAATAATVTNSALASRESDRAVRVARTIGIDHVLLGAEPLERAEYRANGADRCYFCRSVETAALRALGQRRGVVQYLDGIHIDDLSDDRPGLRAVNEAGFDHPFLWAGWSKRDVRAIARARCLPNWAQPADACLASRVARGEPIDRALLARIEEAEGILLGSGFRRVRVRAQGGAARVEVDPTEVDRLRADPMARDIVCALKALGFSDVSLDPRGYPGQHDPLPVLR